MTLVAVLSEDAPDYLPHLSGHADVRPFRDPDRLVEEEPDVELLLADPNLAAGAVARLPRLRWVQSTWAGVDALCGSDAPGHYVLTRVEGIFDAQIREFVFAYLLVHERRVLARLAAQREHRWAPPDHGVLAGKTLGVLGTGALGRAIAGAAAGLGMAVVGCSRSGSATPGFDEVMPVHERLDFAAAVDHLVAALPATRQTERLVDGELIARLGRSSVLVNVGRGSTVDVAAVVRALADGHLAMAVLDVLPGEPLAEESPLWDVPGLFLTAHTAGISRPGDVAASFLANLARWEAGEPLTGVVDVERGY